MEIYQRGEENNVHNIPRFIYSESYNYLRFYSTEDYLKILLLLETKSWSLKISFLCEVTIDFPQEDFDSSHKQM